MWLHHLSSEYSYCDINKSAEVIIYSQDLFLEQIPIICKLTGKLAYYFKKEYLYVFRGTNPSGETRFC